MVNFDVNIILDFDETVMIGAMLLGKLQHGVQYRLMSKEEQSAIIKALFRLNIISRQRYVDMDNLHGTDEFKIYLSDLPYVADMVFETLIQRR